MFSMRFQRVKLITVAAVVLVALVLAGGAALRSEESPVIRVLTASATSSSEDSLPVADLLDPAKTGSWKPQALDSGADEGLFFQFREPVLIDWIEVTVKNGADYSMGLSYYLDGKRSASKKSGNAQDPRDNGVEYRVYSRESGRDKIYTLEAAGEGYLNVKVRAVFIKLGNSQKRLPPEIVSVRFFRQGSKSSIPVEVPISIRGQIIASSTLQPETAYTVQNLFDSRLDFAWSTDGKSRDGVGEGFTMALERPQAISGLVVWNGYQRSETHYTANTRLAKIKVTINGIKVIELPLKDQMGHQILNFPQTEENVRTLNITVSDIYPGNVYKDMLISELRMIGADGRMILLDTPAPRVQTTHKALNKILDKSMSVYMVGAVDYYEGGYPPLKIRLRSNGSFVAYRDYFEVMEGNWEPFGNGVRLFGKMYSTDPADSVYLQAGSTRVESKIFQTNVTIMDVKDLTYFEARKYLKTLMVDRGIPIKTGDDWSYNFASSTGNEDEAMRQAYQFAVDQGAVLMISPLFTDIFLPGDVVGEFWQMP